MEIILTHGNADFDAFACQLAARLIYPDAVPVRPRSLSRPVRDFLALHKDRFEPLPFDQVDVEQVERVILVDVRRAGRLAEYDPLDGWLAAGERGIDVHVYDHHPAAADDIGGSLEVIEPVGAATTLMVEGLRARGITVDPVEATALALGVYFDTGSLCFPGTTPRDVRAAAWLLSRGASLRLVGQALQGAMSEGQRFALCRVLENTTTHDMEGVSIGLARVDLGEFVNGLGAVTGKALAIGGNDALFTVFDHGKRVSVIARSGVPFVDVGEVTCALGGGGHPEAGSATLKGVDPDEVAQRILERLRAAPPRPQLVRHLMTTPVHTVSADARLEEVRVELEAHGVSGAPVLRDGQLVGILSRRDIRAAERDGRLHLKVASCMSHEVETTHPDRPLARALEQMVDADVGRLPVIEEGQLVGIVTRTDVL
ncbi:MAG: CBS domain-containing protein, partial [Deltaproteobacteria bacterium]|nr:CBS domain-containing protein [Deltaproteobacteria bacterium]